MKTKLALVIVSMLVGQMASATTVCSVSKESTPGQYDQVLVTKTLEDEDKSVLLFERERLAIYVNVAEQGKHISISGFDPKKMVSTLAAVGDGDFLVAFSDAQGIAVSCVKLKLK